MRIKLLILTFFYLFFGVNPVFAITFNISNPQQNGDEFTIDVSLSGLTTASCPNGPCYLQAAFTSPSPIRYFGFTKNNNGYWYEYISSPSQSYIQSTFFSFQPVSGAWSGQLNIKINAADPDYHGPGNYNIKAWRYSGNTDSTSGNTDFIAINIQGTASTPTPTPTSNTDLTPNPSPSSASSTSAFTISNTPSQINSNESFNATINLSLPNNPNTTYYLSGAFRIVDGTRYFGLTKINSDWIPYSSDNYLNQYKITTDSSGVWTGNLEVKPNAADSDYKGTGDYIFKVARYTQAGSQTWSDETSIKITGSSVSDSSDSSSSNSSKSSTAPTSSPKPSTIKTIATANSIVKLNSKISSVAGISKIATPSSKSADASSSANIKVADQKNINPFIILGSLFVIIGFISLGLIVSKNL